MSEIETQFAELVKVFMARINWFIEVEIKFFTGPEPDYGLGWTGGQVWVEPGQPMRIVNSTGCVLNVMFANKDAFGVEVISGIPDGKAVTIAASDDAVAVNNIGMSAERVDPPGGGDGGGPAVGIKPPPGGTG